MKRFSLSLICAVGGYLIAAAVGYFLMGQFSTNSHDRTVEAAMTSAFVLGPLGGVAGFIAGFIRSGRGAGRANPGS